MEKLYEKRQKIYNGVVQKYESYPLYEMLYYTLKEVDYNMEVLNNMYIDEYVIGPFTCGVYKKDNKYYFYSCNERCEVDIEEYEDVRDFIGAFLCNCNYYHKLGEQNTQKQR